MEVKAVWAAKPGRAMHIFFVSGEPECYDSYCNQVCAKLKDMIIGPHPNMDYCGRCLKNVHHELQQLQKILDDEDTPEDIGLRTIDRIDAFEKLLDEL